MHGFCGFIYYYLDNVRTNGVKEMMSYLTHLGGSFRFNNGTLPNKYFNLSQIFDKVPAYAITLFLDHRLTFMKDPRDQSSEILSLEMSNSFWRYQSNWEKDLNFALKPLAMDETVKEKAVQDFINFMLAKKPFQVTPNGTSNWEIIQVKELNHKLPLHVDWVEILNYMLLKNNHLKRDDKILIGNFELMQMLFKLLIETENT